MENKDEHIHTNKTKQKKEKKRKKKVKLRDAWAARVVAPLINFNKRNLTACVSIFAHAIRTRVVYRICRSIGRTGV